MSQKKWTLGNKVEVSREIDDGARHVLPSDNSGIRKRFGILCTNLPILSTRSLALMSTITRDWKISQLLTYPSIHYASFSVDEISSEQPVVSLNSRDLSISGVKLQKSAAPGMDRDNPFRC